MAINKGKVMTVSSVKGGTGKTTTLLNLAGIFSKMGKKVLLVDLDLYSGALALSLNLDVKVDIYKLVDDMMNNRFDYIENYVLKYNDTISLLASPKDPRYANKINIKYISRILAKAAMKYDIVLVDTTHLLDDKNLVTLDSSDEILFVINNDSANIKNMKTIVSIFKDMDKTNYKIILNNSLDKTRNYFNRYDFKNILKDNIDYTIPNSFYVKEIDKYVLDGNILTLSKKITRQHRKAMHVFEVIAKDLIKEKK